MCAAAVFCFFEHAVQLDSSLQVCFLVSAATRRMPRPSVDRRASVKRERVNLPLEKEVIQIFHVLKSDVDVDDKHGLNESRSSSNSSLSNRSLDSPSNSSEMVHRTPTSVSADSVPPNFAPNCGLNTSGSHMTGAQSTEDSDLEADADPPNWQENVDWDVLKLMKPKEKKRQDVINEEMLEIHTTFNNKMKARRKTEAVIGDIGQLMLEMFDGTAGEHMKQAAATYCKNQSIALESLKHRQKKDQKLAQSLSDAETNNLCRRLQLKDIIASGFQRLTKYPLLLENIAKYTPPNTQRVN
ncbi:rho guanine nucleotide exchange factor 12 [Caerostris extrusa]|uniref:Rho guanine nucleotide exchange factor 12 n=1 Tax=Caerostris extrusa TaxID=172846 RepID=A0AAV4VQ69_CAEEX|nr:rho guanine nucleotide exchange factor 12 [Caerostris extrusa]